MSRVLVDVLGLHEILKELGHFIAELLQLQLESLAKSFPCSSCVKISLIGVGGFQESCICFIFSFKLDGVIWS